MTAGIWFALAVVMALVTWAAIDLPVWSGSRNEIGLMLFWGFSGVNLVLSALAVGGVL